MSVWSQRSVLLYTLMIGWTVGHQYQLADGLPGARIGAVMSMCHVIHPCFIA